MVRTALQVITDALKLLGVVAGHEVPTSAEQTDAFARLNELIDSWGTHAQTLYLPHRALLTTVPMQQTYTVGPGGDLSVTPIPVTIDAAGWETSESMSGEVALGLATDRAYVAQPVKTLTGRPRRR